MSRTKLSLLILGVAIAFSSRAPAAPPGAYETKAAYLLNFFEFVEWPAGTFSDTTAPFVLGVIGEDPFGPELDKLQAKNVNGRRLQIKRFKGALEFRGEESPGRRQEELALKRAKKLAELRACQILFISASEKPFVPLLLKPLKHSSVLTVGESEAFAVQGGIINFLDDGTRVRFEINLVSARNAGLKISSKLLSLAKVVRNDAPDGKN